MSTPGDPRSIPVPVQVASAGPRLKFARRPSLLMTCGCPCLLVLCLGTAMFGYWLRERARERGRERERQQKERKRERETVSTPLPSTSSGIIRGTSPIQAGAARAVLGPQTPVQEAPGTLQPSLEASASGPTQEDLAPRPHEPAEGESDPTRAHAAPKPP